MDSSKELKRAWLVRLKNRDLHCALCGCLIEAREDISVEHYVPKARTTHDLSGNSYNIRPAIKIINSIKGSLLPCEWHLIRRERLLYAIKYWRLTRHDEAIIIKALARLATEKDLLNPCQNCILSNAKEQCDAARNMAEYCLPALYGFKFRQS